MRRKDVRVVLITHQFQFQFEYDMRYMYLNRLDRVTLFCHPLSLMKAVIMTVWVDKSNAWWLPGVADMMSMLSCVRASLHVLAGPAN